MQTVGVRLRLSGVLTVAIAAGVLLAAGMAAHAVVEARDDWREMEKQSARIGLIDCYGLRTVTPQQIRTRLNLKEGDLAPLPDQARLTMRVARRVFGIETQRSIAERLEQIPRRRPSRGSHHHRWQQPRLRLCGNRREGCTALRVSAAACGFRRATERIDRCL